MSRGREVKIIRVRTPESKQFVADVERAVAITPVLNRLTYADADQVRSLFAELTGQEPGEPFRLIPPFYTDCGKNIRIGARVFINQNCTFYALADVANVKQRLNNLDGAQKDLETCQKVLDTFDSVETVVHASFYKVNAEYYHVSPLFSRPNHPI